jgi:hypothetical protein
MSFVGNFWCQTVSIDPKQPNFAKINSKLQQILTCDFGEHANWLVVAAGLEQLNEAMKYIDENRCSVTLNLRWA